MTMLHAETQAREKISKKNLKPCFHVERIIVIVKAGTQTQPADVMTKVLQKTKHHFYTRILRNNMTDDDVEQLRNALTVTDTIFHRMLRILLYERRTNR